MMPKVTLVAPTGLRGQVHASGSGRNYDIAEDHTVTVDHIDVAPLLATGFQHAHHKGPHKGERDPDQAPIASVAPGSHETGATAIDPAAREMQHRDVPVDTGQQSQDFGAAIPPHGLPDDAPTNATQAIEQKAEAREEVDTAADAGADTSTPSAQPGTGQMSSVPSNADAQAAVRDDPVPETDADRDERFERERMPPEGQRV